MPDDELLTRHTLLIRLRDKADDESWAEFAELYTPLLYAYCAKRELKHADISDIVQDVMRSVSLAMQNFQYDPAKGKFKAWLFTAVRHAVGNHFKKKARQPIASSESMLISLADSEAAAEEIDEWDRDYQRRLLSWAMEKIRPEFNERVWNVFEQTAIHDRENAEVAAEFGMSTNAVAITKHRVIARLREKAESVDAERWEQEMIKREQANGRGES